MEGKSELLYNSLFESGDYTKSFEEFQAQFGTEEKVGLLYDSLSKSGQYTKTAQEFSEQFFPHISLKKKEEPTESISGDGSLDLFEVPEETVDVGVEAEVMEPASTRFDGAATSGGDLVEPARYQDQASRELQEVNQAEMDKSLQIRDEALEGELEAARIAAHEMAISTPEVNAKLEQVNADLIGLPVHGGEAVEKLREIFRGRGFTFEEGMGSWMNVRTTDGLHSIDISLDNFRNASDVAESAELQTFLRSHYNPSLANENEDEISRAMRAQQMRGTNERWNDDGTVSTVKFMSYEQDGVHKVAPTLFPRSTVQAASPRAEDWIELDMDEAIAEAERRGEVFTFDSQEEAEAFAEGSWKTTNSVDVEAQQLYNEHGRDYISDRNAYDNYMDARNARIFLDEEIEIAKTATWGGAGQFDDLTPSEQKAYAKYFREDGSLRADAEEIAESLDDTAAELWKTVNGDDYRIAQEDLDLHLEKRHQALAQEAANENYQAKTIEQGLKNKVLTDFGITLDQLNTYEPKNESERRQLNGMIEVANTLEANKNAAALKYETALTYFDAKANKEVSQEFTNNLEGWWTATSDGYKNGTAAQQLLYLAMGIYDDDESGHERAAKRMTDNMNSVDGRQSRAMSRFNAAEDGWNRETRGALARDPAEVMLTWAASSLSQILPYGLKIIPSFVGVGAGTGAGIGALGANPYTIGAGALTGGMWGLRTGFAATNLVLEYTNGVLDAGREFGYNMNDPQEAAQAFKDERVWERGKERGLKRGIPIAAMDIFMGGLAGRVFAPVAVASRGRKIAAFAAERILLDAPAEATGEFLAQLNVGDEISIKEIMAEFGGAVGNQTPNAAVNIYRATRGNYNQRIAESLMDTKLMAKERASDSQIQTWAKNMRKLGKVSQAQEQRILENVGLRREANELLGVTAPSRLGVGSKVRTRVMELLNVREGLKANKNLREIFSQEIGDINTELAEIARTNKLSEAPTNLDNIDTFDGVGKRSTVPRYRIGNTMYSRAEFLRYIENLSPRRANKILKDSEITNDEETSILLDEKLKEFAPETTEDTSLEVTDAEVSAEIKLRKKEGSRFTEGRVTPEEREEVRNDLLKLKQDAVQESSTAEVDVQEQARDGGAVGEGDVTTETTEEVAPDDQAAEEVEEETVVEVVDKGTRGDIKAFREGTLSAARKNALLAGVAQRLNEGRKLTKFHQEMADVNAFEIAELQAAVAEQDAIALEAADLEASLAADESSNSPVVEADETETREATDDDAPEFRMKGESLGVSQDETDTETFAVLETMNETGAYAMAAQDVEVQRLDALLKSGMNEKGTQKLTAQQKKSYSEKRDELNRVREARETQAKPTKINVEELNSRLDHPLPTVEWKVVDGVPMIFNISDQLRTGDVVNPSTGNTIDNLKGGMGFTGVEGHQGMAWASVTKKKAQGQIDSATKVYNDNKEIFTRWWKENPQYKGLVPMAIVKMGQQSILSNEAVVRVLADNISSFPVAKRKRAMTGFKKAVKEGIKKKKDSIKKGVGATTVKQYQKWIDEAQDVLQMIDYINPTTIDDILTSAALKRLKGITSVNVITDLIMTGKPNEVGKAKKKPGTASKLVSKILLGENPTAAEKAKLNQGVVTDLITEPQLEGVPQRSVFMIQGVDVLNPAVLTTNHPNYEFGPRGKTIGILEQPESVIEKFPAVQNNVLLGIAAEEAGGQKRSERLRLTQVIPVQAGMANTEFVGAIAGIDQRGAVLDFLNRSFPSVTLSVDTETFDNVMASEGVREYLKGDEIVYGVTKDGDVYLNPDVHSSESALYNTAVHEFGHVWTDYLQTTKKGREIYAKGAALVSQTAEYKNQLKRFKKEGLTEEEAKRSAVNETMAILIGNKGETIIDASLKQQFQAWLTAAWTYIKDTFKMSKDLSVEEIQNLTLDEFLGTALADIMSGKPLKLTEVQAKKLKNPEAAFSMSDSMSDIISRGRAEGFSEASIRQVLRARGQSVANIRKAMAVKVEMFSDAVVPFEFGNVEGGMQVGIALFQQVQAELAAFAAPTTRRTGARMTAQERRERLGELRENHPTLVEISDAALLRRYPRRGVQAETVTTQKSVAEVRAKAMEILRANPTFEKQTEAVQMELVIAMDRTLGITANREVSKQISAIRNTLTQRKRAVREVQAIKRQLRQLIRKSLPKSKTYSQADINKMVRAVERVNEDNYRVEVEKVLQVVEKHRAKMRKQVLKTLLSDVRRGAKKAATDTKKDRAGSLSVQGQSFAEQFKKALILALATDSKQEEAMDEFFQLAQQLETDEAVEALAKSVTGDILTSKQERLVNLAVALDLVKNIPSMELEEVQALAKDYKVAAQRSRQELSETRKKRALENDAIKQKVTDSLRRSNPEMFNEDGSLKDHNELRAQIDAVRKYWQEGKGKGLSARVRGQAKAAKLYIETFGMRTPIQLLKSMVDSLKHLGTFMNAINDTLYEEVFTRLNLMDNNALKGYFKQQDILTDLGFDAVKESLLDTKLVTIKGIRSTKTGHVREEQFSKDQLLRIYALSKNPIQRRKLEAMGFDSANMQVIAEALGKDATDFADKVVQYLSNEYYEQVNDVYRAVNDVNLSYIENYFPTMTTQSDVNPKQLFEGDFNGIFNAESAPALRNRQDLKSDIDLKGATFTTALESHIKTMERYKAYADGTKKLNTVFNTAAIDAVLTQYATKGMVKQSVNNSINPDSAKNALNQSGQFFNFLQTQFTSFALAFRIVQIGKQATSFINAFENYSYRKSGKQNVLIDLIPFLMDYGAVIAQPRKYHKLAMKNSPTYKYRVQQGIQGDLTGLESGSPTRTSLDDSTNWRGRLYRGFKKSGAAPTVLGDLTGVMGYMANYRRNIKNGMSEEKAWTAFNEFNQTQQSRRATEKSILQQNSNFLIRAFTMFGSTPILYINNVMQSLTNIWRSLKHKKQPRTKDVRRLALNLGMANAAFVAMSNLGMLLRGDDEEKEEVLAQVKRAMIGVNLGYQFPFLGTVVKMAENELTGKRKPTDMGVNPFVSLVRKMQRYGEDDKLMVGAAWTALEIGVGAQADPFIALWETVTDMDEADIRNVYDILGYSESYREATAKKDYKPYTPAYQQELDRKERIKEMRESNPEYMRRKKLEKEKREKERNMQRYGE